MTRTRGIRVTEQLDREVAREAERRGTTWSTMSQQLLDEALKMRKAPGIVFVDGPTGRRAVVAGSGLDVWEVVATWKRLGGDREKLRREYEWLTEPQLRAALAYYELYPSEIDDRLEREQRWTPEQVRHELPFSRPRTSAG